MKPENLADGFVLTVTSSSDASGPSGAGDRAGPGRNPRLPVMTPSSVQPVSPNKPKTPLHSFRVTDELWNAAKEKARAEGTTIADVLRDALEKYLKKKPR